MYTSCGGKSLGERVTLYTSGRKYQLVLNKKAVYIKQTYVSTTGNIYLRSYDPDRSMQLKLTLPRW